MPIIRTVIQNTIKRCTESFSRQETLSTAHSAVLSFTKLLKKISSFISIYLTNTSNEREKKPSLLSTETRCSHQIRGGLLNSQEEQAKYLVWGACSQHQNTGSHATITSAKSVSNSSMTPTLTKYTLARSLLKSAHYVRM